MFLSVSEKLGWAISMITVKFLSRLLFMQSLMLEVIHIFIEQRNPSDKEVTTNYPIYKISLGVKANKKIIQNFMLHKF